MTEYLSYTFDDTPESVRTFDELPLWSAPFGLLMLKHLELRPNLTVLDIGSGAGFPLLELAGRLGNSCKLFGLDMWTNANARAREKIKNYGLTNVEVIEGSAEHIPFEENTVDLIVSNLGVNNFENPQAVFKECSRVLKPQGRLALATNLNGHWKEFYRVFEETLAQIGREELVDALNKHQEHRGTVESIAALFSENGFVGQRCYEESVEMKFVDGSAFLNHHFVKLGWMASWKSLLPKEELREIFASIEENLNVHSLASNGLTLTVPMAFIEGKKE